MLLRTAFRLSPATILLPLLVAFVVLALGDDLSAWVTPRYWPSATGSAAFALPFVAAACAAAAAWEGARLTKGRVFDQAAVRRPLGIALPVLLPVLMMGLLGILVALIISATAANVPLGLPDFGILAAVSAMLVAHTLVGYILGRVIPRVLAAPVALIGSFFVGAYPASWSIIWLRYLVGGGLSNCCSIDTSVDPRALTGTALFAAGVSGAAVMLIHYGARAVPLAAAFTLVASGVLATWLVARDVDADPLQARATDALVCEDTKQPKVCLWPEVEDPQMVLQEARAAAARLTAAGVHVPDTLTMAAHPDSGALKLGITPDVHKEDIAGGVASGLLPSPPACAINGDPYPAAVAAGPLAAWIYATAGVPEQAVAGRFGAQEGNVAAKVRKLPTDKQLAWYKQNRAALASCNTPPPMTIAGVKE
ncbi:hypothetical protein J3A78_005141 [Streptomyces sp. PvR006]|uniref:DUF7224 domain-containing protein n=1 Tax=unclassified Streptomyces TaxID=2593676 RepID=UPI001AEB08D5|nr:hypothetical protein [Streptomyces sp. PvR006]MBP2584663.1 hypothetical protein [Streptomyces sp. PvR006]